MTTNLSSKLCFKMNGFSVFSILNKESIPIQFEITTILSLSHYFNSKADISIITLTDETALVSVPSKTYNLLAVGTPLLCIASDESELAHLVAAYDCGRCFTKEKVAAMAGFIKELKTDNMLWRTYSNNSMKASLNYTYKNAEQYVS